MLDFLLFITAVTLGSADRGQIAEQAVAPKAVVAGSNVAGGSSVLVQAQVAEPQVATGKFTTAFEVKPILTATMKNWVAVREWEGQDLVYVTHLWAWRCGLTEVAISINGGPLVPWPLPPCHTEHATPNAILDSDGLPYQAFALKSVQFVTVTVTYDDLTTQEAAFTRASILMP